MTAASAPGGGRPLTVFTAASDERPSEREWARVLLKQELAPDAFVALATRLRRPYPQQQGSSASSSSSRPAPCALLHRSYLGAVGSPPGLDLSIGTVDVDVSVCVYTYNIHIYMHMYAYLSLSLYLSPLYLSIYQ